MTAINRDPTDSDPTDPFEDWPTSYYGEPEIEVAWNPASHRWEPIYPESEGYDDEQRVRMFWCSSIGRYVTVPGD